MFDDVDSRNFHVIIRVPRFWIVGLTIAPRFATVALALLAGHVACMPASVGR